MLNRGRVYFKLYGGNFDPDSLAIGIAPTKTARKSAPVPKHSSWIYSTETMEGDVVDVYEMSVRVVTALKPHAQRIREAMQGHNIAAVLQVVLTITPNDKVSTPAVGFDSEVVMFLAQVGASIDVDIYRGEVTNA